ncbi:alternative ribosome rescue aminoacyl-tRNA hydrolase ArfB [Tenacibaculum piscium]|uniref:Peptidyl-tRNA hydrolase ArfB n=1 Tax=Tenacibaculum piscium TaxID=1458515 RepID=A0A2H1YJE4_9FLAO|nr:alternative ribosome rescue aminoacyl-tRNA hydrolase ArfB [Tenacibaculum piscium]MBE7628740.1 aminoacyl-tRNA hydrolase [Tenacibaculum piscium]MBE7669881.1 aminoacyl-tRNA hydrolase [Tenacibaculum piscium]MBE7684524.1 aminoacyl-tRNA hydrolase [Tenacibaculum piscium]MBE7689144.1 aminoacyl-tRNA hydrolase [Tenacibaculum piscium]SOS75530.1 Peptidyl-tRNA hydrolase ArfB [Tenacibaculum piscium]
MNIPELLKELHFKATRSSGAGGQHVNKVSSKIELSFDILNSKILSENQKEILYTKLASRLTKEQVLILFSDETRSQHRNKELAIKRFLYIIKEGLKKPKIRRATKPSRNSVLRKHENKKRQAFKKSLRKKPDLES